MNTFTNAIWVTVIGMGLVFGVILLLWLFIAIVVRVFAPKLDDKEVIHPTIEQKDLELKKRAAIVAVAIALARYDEGKKHEFPLPPTAQVSAWHAVNRGQLLKKQGRVR